MANSAIVLVGRRSGLISGLGSLLLLPFASLSIARWRILFSRQIVEEVLQFTANNRQSRHPPLASVDSRGNLFRSKPMGDIEQRWKLRRSLSVLAVTDAALGQVDSLP